MRSGVRRSARWLRLRPRTAAVEEVTCCDLLLPPLLLTVLLLLSLLLLLLLLLLLTHRLPLAALCAQFALEGQFVQ